MPVLWFPVRFWVQHAVRKQPMGRYGPFVGLRVYPEMDRFFVWDKESPKMGLILGFLCPAVCSQLLWISGK